jgi:hypothetical protein
MNYQVVERVLRTAVTAAGFDFTAQPAEFGERIDFAIWARRESTGYPPVAAIQLYAPHPGPRLKDFENEQQVKECAGCGLRAARRAAA